MKADPVKLQFDNTFVGELTSPTSTIKLGSQEQGMKPYHLLFGALASCFYATFLSVSTKMRLTFDRAEIEVNGHKRDETPATLDHVVMDFTIYGGTDKVKLEKAAELGTKYCSIHETISKVAQMELKVTFKD